MSNPATIDLKVFDRKKLKKAREDAGLSQQQVADELGHGNRTRVCHLESGRTRPDPDTLAALKRIYSLPSIDAFYS